MSGWEWISVKESLSSIGTMVWLRDAEGCIYTGRRWPEDCHVSHGREAKSVEITHWKPLRSHPITLPEPESQ